MRMTYECALWNPAWLGAKVCMFALDSFRFVVEQCQSDCETNTCWIIFPDAEIISPPPILCLKGASWNKPSNLGHWFRVACLAHCIFLQKIDENWVTRNKYEIHDRVATIQFSTIACLAQTYDKNNGWRHNNRGAAITTNKYSRSHYQSHTHWFQRAPAETIKTKLNICSACVT